MRVLLGIAISLPIAAIFCVAYLTALALETLRGRTASEHRNPRQREPWTGPARIAA
ncbi:MAG: hypothetical protein ACREFT_16960 [Acetobacteraceae bacterium]